MYNKIFHNKFIRSISSINQSFQKSPFNSQIRVSIEDYNFGAMGKQI
jgi:hypothetical protein